MEYIVVIRCESVFGLSLAEQAGKPGGARRMFVAGDIRHPAIYCSVVDVDSSLAFVRLTQIFRETDAPGGDWSRRSFLVPNTDIVLVYEVDQGEAKAPIGFVPTA